MNRAETKKQWERAHAYAIRRGYSQHADDFAQEACLAWFRGRKASPEQLLIDFLRAQYGSARVRSSYKHPANSPNGSKFKSIDAPIGDSERTLHDVIPSPGGDTKSVRVSGKYGVSLSRSEALVLHLIEEEGMSQTEIAELLGRHPTRICQIFKAVKKKLRDEILMQDFYDTYTDFKETSEIVIDWIAI